MGYAIASGTHRISLAEYDGSDNWFDIKANRSAADTEWLLREVGPADNAQEVRGAMLIAGRFVVAWNLLAQDGDTEPMPLAPQTFASGVPLELTLFIAQKTAAYYESLKPTPDQLGNSNGRLKAP